MNNDNSDCSNSEQAHTLIFSCNICSHCPLKLESVVPTIAHNLWPGKWYIDVPFLQACPAYFIVQIPSICQIQSHKFAGKLRTCAGYSTFYHKELTNTVWKWTTWKECDIWQRCLYFSQKRTRQDSINNNSNDGFCHNHNGNKDNSWNTRESCQLSSQSGLVMFHGLIKVISIFICK